MLNAPNESAVKRSILVQILRLFIFHQISLGDKAYRREMLLKMSLYGKVWNISSKIKFHQSHLVLAGSKGKFFFKFIKKNNIIFTFTNKTWSILFTGPISQDHLLCFLGSRCFLIIMQPSFFFLLCPGHRCILDIWSFTLYSNKSKYIVFYNTSKKKGEVKLDGILSVKKHCKF